MRIALTGVTGGVGTALALAARARGDHVRALARDPARADRSLGDGVEIVKGDLSDGTALEELARGADVFVHAAAHVGDWGPREEFERVNVGGTKAAVVAAARARVKRFVHVSSVAVYGRPDTGTIDETYEPRPFGAPYEDTKLAAERFAFERGRTLGMEVTAVRPPIIFGEHDRQFVPRLLGRLAKRRVILIDGGRFPLNLVDVADVVDVLLRCTDHPGAVGEAFNVAASPPPLVREVFETIADAAGLRRPSFSVPQGVAMALAHVLDVAFRATRAARPPMVTPFVVTQLTRDVVYDAGKARRVLGWTGGHDPLVGLRRAALFHTQTLSSSATGTRG